MTEAAWLLGMPPVSTNRRTLIFRSCKRKVNTLLSCTRKPQRSAWTSGFDVNPISAPPRLGRGARSSRPIPEEGGERFELRGAPPEVGSDPRRLVEEAVHGALGARDPAARG